jgi:hypothetical protein
VKERVKQCNETLFSGRSRLSYAVNTGFHSLSSWACPQAAAPRLMPWDVWLSSSQNRDYQDVPKMSRIRLSTVLEEC